MVSTRVLIRAACGFAAAAAVIAITPSAVDDARLPLWRGAAHWASVTTAEFLHSAAHRLAGFGGLPELLVRDEGGPAPGPTGPVASLGPQTAAEIVRGLGLDPTGVIEALGHYHAGNLAAGDAAAAAVRDPIVDAALEWIALRTFPPHAIGPARLRAFVGGHPDWPARGWLERRIEEAVAAGPSAEQRAVFAATPPETLVAKLAAVKLFEADGRTAEAAALVKSIWRELDLAGGLESKVKADYGHYLDKADHKFRADRLLYKEQAEAGLRAAALAGPDVAALARLRVAMIHDSATDKLFAAVPAELQGDPAFLLARIQKLRRADKVREAATLMQSAPRDPKLLVSGDEWWVERRLVARKLLDLGDAKAAYQLCVDATPSSPDARVEAAFHAGWIALRFMNEPALAAPHFAAMAALATGPTSAARAAYWQGRVADSTLAADAPQVATAAYEKAAAFPLTYYGQLARSRLGRPAIAPAAPVEPATGPARAEFVRVAELLFALGERELAVALSTDGAQHLDGAAQAAALAAVVDKERDAHLALAIGKLLNRRGIAIEALAFPRYGVPPYDPLPHSAPRALVYAVARQESGFEPKAVSSAGALGLMQMIAPTARKTAERAGLAFDPAKLVDDAAFNARLGAAHLGQLLDEQNNSALLVLAAYNAGGKRVKDWIDAYGDPRTPGVDPVDWVERIPFTETRNYVQRCLENFAIYTAAFARADESAGAESAHLQARL